MLNNNAVKTAGNVNNVETAVNEIATSATSQAQETQGATESIISMGTMIEDSTNQVKSMNETADVMNASGQIAKKALEELGEINERATESINVIYEQTNTTNDSALKIKDATSLIASLQMKPICCHSMLPLRLPGQERQEKVLRWWQHRSRSWQNRPTNLRSGLRILSVTAERFRNCSTYDGRCEGNHAGAERKSEKDGRSF